MSETTENAAGPDREAVDNHPIEHVLDDAIASSPGDSVSLHQLLEKWGDRSYGQLFIVLGVVAGSPLAIIPPASAVVGVVVVLFAAQMAFGKRHPWAPRWALERSIPKSDLEKVRLRAHPTLAMLDKLVKTRLEFAAGSAARRAAAIAVLLLGILMVPLDAVPFVVAAPSWAVVLFGVAITARDGLVMLIATAALFGVAALAISVL